LFAQAKGRDFWQSPILAIHMLLHAILAGMAVYLLSNSILGESTSWIQFLKTGTILAILFNLGIMGIELSIKHPTKDGESVAKMITSGIYKKSFWFMVVVIGNLIPLVLLILNLGD
ncbi:MAG: NrfD/PsrC family molybdoenzyme membrane anchor subunit, partial [Bacteroidota bacterium]